MPFDRDESDPYSTGLVRARMRLRSHKRRISDAPPRRAAAILTMVDLLSCAFGGGIFLFLLTAAPAGYAPGAAPSARTNDGFLKIHLTSDMVRPIFVLKQTKTDYSFVVDGASLVGRSVERRVAEARSGIATGRVYAIGPTPWDVAEDAPQRSLTLRFEEPVADWCIRFATADDDSSARKRGANQIAEAPIVLSIQRPGSRRIEVVGTGQLKIMPPPLQFSPCIDFSFKSG